MTDKEMDPPADATSDNENNYLATFQAALQELDHTPAELAKRLYRLGDHRSPKVIIRGIQRILAGETRVSGEMLVIVKLLVRERRRLQKLYSDLVWQPVGNGSHTTVVGEFTVSLHPQTRGRWLVNLVSLKTGYSPPWQEWLDSFDAAKKKALLCVEDAYNEVHELEMERHAPNN